MLEIRQLRSYNFARYPHAGSYTTPPRQTIDAIRAGAALAALTALLQQTACLPGAYPVRMVSETDARTTINQVFLSRQINLTSDYVLTVRLNPHDSSRVTLDGYDTVHGIGFEYITPDDENEFSRDLRRILDDKQFSESPHILTVGPVYERHFNEETRLRQIAESFLDSLKAHGVI